MSERLVTPAGCVLSIHPLLIAVGHGDIGTNTVPTLSETDFRVALNFIYYPPHVSIRIIAARTCQPRTFNSTGAGTHIGSRPINRPIILVVLSSGCAGGCRLSFLAPRTKEMPLNIR